MQVVTNENMQEFIQNRKVADFVPPKVEANPEKAAETPSIDLEKSIDIANDEKKEQLRGEDGKFVKADQETDQSKEAAKTAVDDEDADLPERVKRQIGKKHRAMKEAEEFARERDRQAAVAEARAEALERELQALRGTKSGPAQESKDGPPKPEDFKTVAEYADALTDYKLEQKLRKYREDELQRQQRSSQDQAQAEFVKHIEEVRKDIPDYDEIIADADINVPAHIAQYIAESGKTGVLLGVHFARNPDVLERLSKLSPLRAVAELGKLETQFEPKPKAAPAPTVSKAPSPIAPLGGNSTPVHKDPSDMTFQELRAFRQAERASGKR